MVALDFANYLRAIGDPPTSESFEGLLKSDRRTAVIGGGLFGALM